MDFDLALSLHLCDIRGLASSSASASASATGGVLVYHQNYPLRKALDELHHHLVSVTAYYL